LSIRNAALSIVGFGAVFVIALKLFWKFCVIALLAFAGFVFPVMLIFRFIVVVHGTG
jgi:hypothetical protein